MKKILALIIGVILLIAGIYYAFIYYVPYSEGVRSGELIKISHKGVFVKTWEGEISQGISGAQIFSFSVEDKETTVIDNLKKYQGRYVKVTYKERFGTFFWLGDTKYFITKVEEEASPHFRGVTKENEQ
ncbi:MULTISPECIES: 6-phosphogluconate dehydrogenase [unclassified Tenacibaculum]|uniref:6-phosphogluconate dehydrogenase n=1 Tax=Tenacibaculum TaxID=104267 RepID=UPI001F27B838|nr:MULTISPECIES: 6-phosphogluconate dehydrogenase [unclassified Tenacibaculum]MCF2876351.1 6-phosphogluconate dehydrogenase [Tenacibaculum sp. Cn5-1]MCF2936506.1 6-phosphogluconate dehydrogenase [Tenacibaculum sp. Cn5-34]MCG7512769.1 6-phosphogluconate dehydrogenase [Tenacibaculum sp. Cn5-46]